MMDSRHDGARDALALAILGPLCCLALPLLAAASAGAGFWIVGAAMPVVLGLALAGFVVGRWWRARRRI